jgi:hypothetical protein
MNHDRWASIKHILFCASLLATSACAEKKSAVLWTSKAETAIYAQLYNSAQTKGREGGSNKYKIEVKFTRSLSQDMLNEKSHPDIVIGSDINTPSVLASLDNMEKVFRKKIVDKDQFYSELLKTDIRNKNKAYLLPVSFNLPVIMFKGGGETEIAEKPTIDLDELRTNGISYNVNEGDRIRGFSPLWTRPRSASGDFLILCSRLFDVDFAAEKTRLVWDEDELDATTDYLKEWIALNGGYQNEEDFIYKYFFNPAPKLIASGRIRYAFMDSDEYFLSAGVSAGTKAPSYAGGADEFDFRWLSKDDRIPVSEDIVFLGIHKKSDAKDICYDFIRWFFTSETQNLLLEESHRSHLSESVFGIAGGFSSLPEVNESVFPKYYEAVLGHLPTPEALKMAPTAPAAWREIKDAVIIPYMIDAIRLEGSKTEGLDKRLRDWHDLQRNTFK